MQNARLQRPNGEIRILRFSNVSIFLTIDFQMGIMAEGSTLHLTVSRKIIQKEVSFKNSQTKI